MSGLRKGLIVLGIVASLLLPGMVHVAARQAHPVPLRIVHVVKPGETLWVIARDVRPGHDVLETVDLLERVNHLPDGRIRAGQPLFLPAS